MADVWMSLPNFIFVDDQKGIFIFSSNLRFLRFGGGSASRCPTSGAVLLLSCASLRGKEPGFVGRGEFLK